MKLIILIYGLILFNEEVRAYCDGHTINGLYYEKEKLATTSGILELLAVDKTGELYVDNYGVGISKINVHTKQWTHMNTSAVPVTNLFALNLVDNEVYIAGEDAIYTHNFATNETYVHNSWRGEAKRLRYYNNKIYIATEHSLSFQWVVIENDTAVPCEELTTAKAKDFTIDDNNDLFYYNYTGLYYHKVNNEVNKVNIKSRGDDMSRYLTAITIYKNQPYVLAHDGLYLINKTTFEVETLFKPIRKVGYTTNFIFDDNNGHVIYSEFENGKNHLYYLKRNKSINRMFTCLEIKPSVNSFTAFFPFTEREDNCTIKNT